MCEQDTRAMVHRVRSNEPLKLERVYTKKTEVANEIFCGCSKIIQVVNGIDITLPKHAKVRLNIEYELVIGCIFPVS